MVKKRMLETPMYNLCNYAAIHRTPETPASKPKTLNLKPYIALNPNTADRVLKYAQLLIVAETVGNVYQKDEVQVDKEDLWQEAASGLRRMTWGSGFRVISEYVRTP